MTSRRWVRVCSLRDLEEGRGVAALVDGRQVALFLLPGAGGEPAARLRALDNRDPVSDANVLSRGLLGSAGDVDYVASPLHKHRFDLATGQCLDRSSPGVRVWPVRVWGTTVEVLSVSTNAAEKPKDPGSPTATHCPFCALQCGMRLVPSDRNGDVRNLVAAGDATFGVTEGRMCIKGWSSVELLRSPDRLTAPLVRGADGALRRAGWDAALDELAGRLDHLRTAHGAESVGVFGSGALTNEAAYLLGKFARVALRTPHIDYNGRYCMSSAAAAQNQALGIDRGLPFPVSDIQRTDTLVLWGANPADTMPPLMAWVDRMKARGGRLIVVDPRRTATARAADEHVQPVPGTDLAVVLGLLHLAVAGDAYDGDYIARRTAGWDEVAASTRGWTPERVRAVSGIETAQLKQTFDALARPRAAMVLTGRGPEQQSKGTDTVLALINLMLCLGRVGRPYSGYGCLTGQANGQGGREHGQKADQLPGYRSIEDPADRQVVARAWGLSPDDLPGPGRSASELLSSIGTPGGVRGLLVAGSDVTVASPGAGSVRSRLAELDCLAVLDAFPSETAERAHFVLPVSQWAEEDGTITSLEGRVLRRRRAIPRPDGVRSDIEVLCDLAARLGQGRHFQFGSPEAVFEELRVVSAGGRADYSGITWARIDSGEALHWPCPSEGHPGTPRLFSDRFAHADGRARFVPVTWRPAAELPDADYPLWFTTGRYREHYNSGNQTRRIDALAARRPEPLLHMHPDAAEAAGIPDGSVAAVESRRGAVRFRVALTDDVRPDTTFAPFHWGGRDAANVLTNPALDPTSRMPEFKLCAVRVTAVDS